MDPQGPRPCWGLGKLRVRGHTDILPVVVTVLAWPCPAQAEATRERFLDWISTQFRSQWEEWEHMKVGPSDLRKGGLEGAVLRARGLDRLRAG